MEKVTFRVLIALSDICIQGCMHPKKKSKEKENGEMNIVVCMYFFNTALITLNCG